MPGLIGNFAFIIAFDLDQDGAGEEYLFFNYRWDQHLRDFVLHPERLDARVQAFAHFPLIARVRENLEPSLRHVSNLFLALFGKRDLLDFQESQFDRRCASEDRDADFEHAFVVVDLLDDAYEAGERAVRNSHRLAALEREFRLRFFGRDRDVVDDLVDLFRSQRGRLLSADEAGHFGRALDQMPRLIRDFAFIITFDLHQHVAREEHARALYPLGPSHLDNRFGRDQHLSDLILHPEGLDARVQAVAHFSFIARICMNYEPLLRHKA